VTQFIYYLFVFLAGGGCGFALALRLGGIRALWRLSIHDYRERLRRTGLD
jgi:hypothetical protein